MSDKHSEPGGGPGRSYRIRTVHREEPLELERRPAIVD